MYLTDLMHRVGATSATVHTNALGETTVVYELPDGRKKEQKLRRTAQLIDDRNQERK